MRPFIYALIGFSIVHNVVAGSLMVFFSVMVFELNTLKCLELGWIICGILNLCLDLTIWSLPLRNVFSVASNHSTRKRVLLVLVFTVGALGWGSSLLRIPLAKQLLGLGGVDGTYYTPIFFLLYVAEISLAIGCVSVVTLRRLVVKIANGLNTLGKITRHVFRASPAIAQPKGYRSKTTSGSSGTGESRTGGYSATGNESGCGEDTTVNLELVEWKGDALNIKRPQFIQQACDDPCGGGDIELGSRVAQCTSPSCPRCQGYSPSPIPGTHIQVPAPAATGTGLGTSHRLSSPSTGETLGTTSIDSASQGAYLQPSCSACDALPSSESTVNLMGTNTNSSACSYAY